VRFHSSERVALFIDGVALYHAARTLAVDIDYRRLLAAFSGKARLIRALYYTVLPEDQDYSPVRPLIDWLGYNGFTVVTKPARDFADASGRRKPRASMEVDMAVDMMELGETLDHVVLFSGDGDFRRLVEALQRRGLRVSVVSTLRGNAPMVADELRRQADQFIDLSDLAPDIIRRQVEPRPRPAPARTPERASDRPRATPAEPFRDPADLPE
jgi:uncharacterized LabA/DUF88 family protein